MMRFRLNAVVLVMAMLMATLVTAVVNVPFNAMGTGANDDPSGAMWFERDVTAGGTVNSGDDPVDWWKFNGSDGEVVDVQIWVNEYTYSSPSMALYLYGPDSSTTLVGSDTTDEYSDEYEYGLHIHATLSGSGVYYVKVYTDDSRTIQYLLHWDSNMASNVAVPSTTHNDLDSHLDAYDWWYFSVDGPTDINITLTMEPTDLLFSDMDFDLYLYDSSSELTSSTKGAGQNESILYSLPSAGNYFIKCLAYETGYYNYGNYTLTVAEQGGQSLVPDLTVISLTPTTAQVNNSVTYTATVKNAGAGTAVAPIDVAFYIDGSNTPYTYYRIGSNIAPSGTATATFTYTFTTTGTHTIDTSVDYTNNISESNEGNNIFSQQISVTGSGGSGDDDPSGATELQPTDSVSDTVDKANDQFDWYKVHITTTGVLNITLSWNTADDLDLYLYASGDLNNPVDSSALTSNPEEISYDVQNPDYYYIAVKAYSGSSVPYTLDVSFTPMSLVPDLTPISLTPTTASTGTATDFTITIKNLGYTSGGYDVEVYIDSTSSPAYTESMSSLATGQTDTATFTHTFGTPGSHNIYVFVDSGNAVAESNEDNNWLNTTVSVTGNVDDSVPDGATEVQPNSTTSDSVTGGSDDIDFYKVHITAPGLLDITLSWSTGDDLDLYLYYETDTDNAVDQSSTLANPESISYSIDGSSLGYYYIKVKGFQLTDGTNVPYTLDLNFQPSTPGQTPDLTVTSISPTTAVVNQSYSYTVVVSNPSNNPVNTPFTLAVYYDGSTMADDSVSIPSLGAQQQTSVSFTTTFYTTGQHTVKAIADPGNNIVESDETNNELTVTVTVQPEGENQPPVAVISQPAEGSTFTTSDTITFDASGSSDPDGDQLVYKWESNLDGVLGSSETITKKLSAGNHKITLTVDDNRGGVSHAMVNITVTSSGVNQPPTVTITEPDGNNDFADTLYMITWTWSDPDGDNCTISLGYDTDTDSSQYTPIISGMDASVGSYKWDTSLVPPGNYYIYARIVDEKGESATAYSPGKVTISHNTPPTVKIIEPDGKDDKASDTYTITWTANDAEQGTDLSISIYYFTFDDSDNKMVIDKDLDNTGSYDWDVSDIPEGDYGIYLVADDGKGGVSDATSSGFVTVVHNAPPSKPSGLKPESTHELRPRISWSASTDPDGDTVFYHVTVVGADGETIVNDMAVYQTSMVMPRSLNYGSDGLGQEYTVTIIAEDSNGAQSDPFTATFTVTNSPPDRPTVSITPANATSGSVLTCTVTGGSDPDGDSVKYRYEWFRNGESVSTPGGDYVSKLTSEILGSMVVKSDTWKCVVTPWDGYVEGESAEVSITIGNSAPKAVIAQPTEGKELLSPEVTLDATGSSDADKNDELTYTWTDDVDGELGTGKVLEVTLSPGWHNITLTVSDGEDTSIATVMVRVLSPYVIVEEGSLKILPEGLKAGNSGSLNVVVKNIGDAPAQDVTVVFLDNSNEVGRATVKNIPSGGSKEVTVDWTPAEGEHSIVVYILDNPKDDSGNYVGSLKYTTSIESASSTGTASSSAASESGGFSYLWLIVIFLLIVIIIVVILILMTRPRKKKKSKRVEKRPYGEAEMQYQQQGAEGVYAETAGYYDTYPYEHPYQYTPEQSAYAAGGETLSGAAYQGAPSLDGEVYSEEFVSPAMAPPEEHPQLGTTEYAPLNPPEEHPTLPQPEEGASSQGVIEHGEGVEDQFKLPEENEGADNTGTEVDEELKLPEEDKEVIDSIFRDDDL